MAATSADEYGRPVDYENVTGPRAVARAVNSHSDTMNRSTVYLSDPDDPATLVPYEDAD